MMLKPIALATVLLISTLISGPVLAADLDTPTVLGDAAAPVTEADKEAPVEITADKTLEWRKDERQYVARVNAMVKKGNTTIKADTITADYRDDKKAGADIYRMTGIGNVRIDDNGNIVTGDKVVYDMDAGLATVTGDMLSMTSPEQTVTAKEKFEYVIKDGQIRAIGDAKLVRANDALYGDTLTAFLADDGTGKKSLSRLDAVGHVKVVTPNENLTGNKATYNAKDDTAIVFGNVKILRDKNVLTGERAEVNLTTNVSRLFGSSIEDGQTGGRVRGVFYPGSEKKKTTDKAPTAKKDKETSSVFTTTPDAAPEPVIVTTPAANAVETSAVQANENAAPAKTTTKKGPITTDHKQRSSTPN